MFYFILFTNKGALKVTQYLDEKINWESHLSHVSKILVFPSFVFIHILMGVLISQTF